MTPKDIEALQITDNSNSKIYILNDTPIENGEEEFEIKGNLIIFRKFINDLIISMTTNADNNEIFYYEVFRSFICALEKITNNKLDKKHILDKYDLLLVMVSCFVYEGFLITESPDKLELPMRSFEGLGGIKIGKFKGIAGFFKK